MFKAWENKPTWIGTEKEAVEIEMGQWHKDRGNDRGEGYSPLCDYHRAGCHGCGDCCLAKIEGIQQMCDLEDHPYQHWNSSKMAGNIVKMEKYANEIYAILEERLKVLNEKEKKC